MIKLRFGVRGLMLMVAAVAIALAAERTRRAWSEFREEAEVYALKEESDLFAG